MSGCGCVAVVLLCGLVAAVIVGTVLDSYWHWRSRQRVPSRPLVVQNPEERRQEVKADLKDNQPLKDKKPLDEKDIPRELKPLFEDLGAALNANDGFRVVAYFDLDRMTDELGALPGLRLDNPDQRQAFVNGMVQGMGKSLPAQPFLNWNASEIRSVKKLNDDEAIVLVRHKHPIGGTLKFRWWVTRRGGSWKVYDLEDLDGGTRFSVMVGTVVAQGLGKALELSRAVKAIKEALEAVVMRQDADSAERKLNAIARIELPREIDALRYMVWGGVHLTRRQPEPALVALDKAHDLHPDMPVLDLLKGRAYSQLNKWDEAIKHFQAYRDLLGEDSMLCHELGLALRMKSRFAEAAQLYRQGLDLDPKDADSFFGLLSCLTNGDKWDDLGERFIKLDNLREHFQTYAADCERRDLIELMEPIARAMQKVDPQYALVDYYLALIKVHTGPTDEAVPLFKSALDRQPDGESRRICIGGFLKAMMKARKLAEGYAAVPDSRETFQFVATEALKQYRLDVLM